MGTTATEASAVEVIQTRVRDLVAAVQALEQAAAKIEALGAEINAAAHRAMETDALPTILAYPITEFASQFKDISFGKSGSTHVDLLQDAMELVDLIDRLTAPAELIERLTASETAAA